MVALCVWAACYHTPVGALGRRIIAWSIGIKGPTKPLLAYYGGGSTDSGYAFAPRALPNNLAPGGDLAPQIALGTGVHASWFELPEDQRVSAVEEAKAAGISRRALEDPKMGPGHMARLVDVLRPKLGDSNDAAVLAVMCGREPARYALERATAEGGEVTFQTIARHLPPEFEERAARAAQALALSTAYALSWPVSSRFPITSPFGERDHPTLGGRRIHQGVDVSMPIGTPVHATSAGTVRRVSEDSINGKLVVLDHGNGVTTSYCHNSIVLVALGDRVERGHLITRSGNSGRSTGPHLHYQLELGEEPVDPLQFRSSRKAPLVSTPTPL
jgi:murein DD-endopeptidase